MVNADHTINEQTERSESMRQFIVKSVLLLQIFFKHFINPFIFIGPAAGFLKSM